MPLDQILEDEQFPGTHKLSLLDMNVSNIADPKGIWAVLLL
jgi:hypothetical protein